MYCLTWNIYSLSHKFLLCLTGYWKNFSTKSWNVQSDEQKVLWFKVFGLRSSILFSAQHSRFHYRLWHSDWVFQITDKSWSNQWGSFKSSLYNECFSCLLFDILGVSMLYQFLYSCLHESQWIRHNLEIR